MYTIKDYMLCYIVLKLGGRPRPSHDEPTFSRGEWNWDNTFDTLVHMGNIRWRISIHPDMYHD